MSVYGPPHPCRRPGLSLGLGIILELGMCLLITTSTMGQEPPGLSDWQRAAFTLDPVKQKIAGLDLVVDVDPSSHWPRISRQMPLCTGRHADPAVHEPDATRPYNPIYLGTIRVPEVSAAAPKLLGRTWTNGTLSVSWQGATAAVEAEPPALTVTTSRLSPGVLIRGASRLSLFAGSGQAGTQTPSDAVPTWFATEGEQGVVVQPAGKVGELPRAGLGQGWLLAWYGQRSFFKGIQAAVYTEGSIAKDLYAADCPMLILFGRPPASLQTRAGQGLCIDFGDQPGQMVVLPLMGQVMPKAEQTEKWKDGLPADVVERCRWWAGHAAQFPISSDESYSYDAASDTTTIMERVRFEPFRASGLVASPLPPMIALARQEGFPVELSREPRDVQHFASAGPLLMVEGTEPYQMRFKGLGKYVAPRPPAGGGQAPAELSKALADQVRKIVEAGHLAPWFRARKLCDGWKFGFFAQTAHLVHANPGETLFYLADVLPLLPTNLQEQVRAYLKRERTEWPPEKLGLMLGGQGARREAYGLTSIFLRDKPTGPEDFDCINYSYQQNFFVSHKLIPQISLYYLAAYYQALGTDGLAEAWPGIQAVRLPYLRQMDWATGSTHQWPGTLVPTTYQRWNSFRTADPWYGNGGVVDANHAFAASVGQIRLAQLAKDAQAEMLGWGLLARTAALRYALGKMPACLYRRGLLTTAPGAPGPEQDLRLPAFVDEFGVSVWVWIYDDNGLIMLRDAVPELVAFAKDHLAAEARQYYGQFERGLPAWYLAWNEQTLDGESNRLIPEDVHETFLAHASIFGDSPQWLEKHLDLPWQARGDLYYLHKLAETIRAYQGQK